MEITGSTLVLQPGMYILRHPKNNPAPLSIARAPGAPGSGKMETLGNCGTHGAILRDGGDCIVLHISEAPVTLLVTAFLDNKDDPIPALRLDEIGLERAPAPLPADTATTAAAATVGPRRPAFATMPLAPRQAAAAGIEIPAHGVTLIGHIERSGDSVAAAGDLLGDPDGLLRLEGFQVMWPDRPQGVDLAYGIVIEGAGAMPIVKTGKFCGTRGEARRITEVTFALIGPRAGQFRLDGMAYFSGGFQAPVQSAVPLSGPSGLEHLTALSLRAAQQDASPPASNPWNEAASTRVFKAPAGAATNTATDSGAKGVANHVE